MVEPRNRNDVDSEERLLFQVGNAKGEFVQFKEAQPVQQDVPDWDGTDTLTVSTTAIPLDKGLRLSHNYCRIVVNTEGVRLWLDGTVPTSSSGQLFSPGDVIILESADELQDAQFIRASGTDASLSCMFGNR